MIWSTLYGDIKQFIRERIQRSALYGIQGFWNIAYFDQPYFNGMFEDFVFPDGSEPCWDSVNWLQKDFMKWFNAERLKTATSFLSFPVETVNLLDNGTDYVDKEWKDFTAQMWAEGHSFFCYRSNSVDSLASCCFDGDERFITDKGAYSFNEFKPGDKVIVPTHDGTLQKATVNTYGKQELQEITFLKGVTQKTVHATKNHRWILDDGSITQNLHIGDKLLRTPNQSKNNSPLWGVKDIRPLNKKELVWCLEVENNHSFLLEDGLVTGNCRLRNEIQENTFSFTLGAGGVSTGSKGVITININRLVQNVYKKNPHATLEDVSKTVREQIHKVHCYLTAFNEIIKDNFKSKMLPVYDAGYIALEKQYLSLGINGFLEGAEFLGVEISPNEEYFAYGEAILKPIYEENKKDKTSEIMFNTEFVPAENLGVKNAKWDKEDGYYVPRDCYNSYFYVVEDENTNLLDKFILHGDKLTKYLDGGSALHANLEEHLSKEQYLKMLEVAIKTGCSYFTFNIPNTACNDCGYISKHKLTKCPKCGSENLDYITRVIGYMKRISSFSEARQKEEKQRYYDKVKV